jgi:hypothetical protein
LEYQIILGILATIIVLAGYLSYFRDVLFGVAKSHAFSWLIWGVLNGLTFFA